MSKKKNKDTNRSGCFTTLVVFFLFIGIPFFITKQCTAKQDATHASAVTEAADVERSTDDVAAGGTNESSVVTDASRQVSDDASEYQTTSVRPQTYAQDKNGIYQLTGPVMDTAHVLSDSEYSELDSFLRNLDQTTSVQIAVLTVDSLGGEDIESFSMKYAEAWKLGQKGVDNGALLTVAMEEHGLRIETGYGTEGTLTDAKCAQIIRNVIVPEFKKNDYGTGIVNGVKNMAGIITSNSELVTISDNVDEDSEELTVQDIIIMGVIFLVLLIVVVMQILMSIARRLSPLSWLGRTGQHIHDTNVARNSHGGGSGWSGGGFSGGGGSFGGGGASGSW